MQQITVFLRKKKIFFLTAGIIIIVIILVVLFRLNSSQESVKRNLSNINILSVPTHPVSLPDHRITILPSNDKWVLGNNKYYSIFLPSSWKPEFKNILGGGMSATLQPGGFSKGNSLPRFHIEVSPADPEFPISGRIETLTPLKMKQVSVNFHDVPAIRLMGTMPFTLPNEPLIYKSFIFLEKSDLDYIITYAYYEDSDAEQYEQLFSAMLDSFQFK